MILENISLKTFSAVAYIYRDNRRMVEPPTVVHSVAEGLSTPIQSARPTPGFGLKWSLNAEDPVVRTNADFGLKPGRDFVQGIVHSNLD